ncbi:MAG: hypothetical protein AUI36_33975 [Cyanobacteria bacterium 13_1_40CM_2_61_4]|nr:MAG: hypothetical protein AUI36_33975 [Cyanobacteria bacterium 13_1_40CM_2_61_4]
MFHGAVKVARCKTNRGDYLDDTVYIYAESEGIYFADVTNSGTSKSGCPLCPKNALRWAAGG